LTPDKLVPVMVTVVPPLEVPDVGVKDVIVGPVTKSKPGVPVSVVPVPLGEITETGTPPAVCALVTAVINVELVTV
jgi:hypothetical protein